jgi:predicted DNA-binding transcriptional regulator YafY
MQSATERRQLILEYLLEHREATRAILADKFAVSYRTIERDILLLSCSYPITTVQGGGGGIKIANGYRFAKRYLSDEQSALLERLSETLIGEELITMKSILKSFSFPKTAK